ncbi:2og-fe oxygenase family protein [Colletotrichum truncatum]|uniref:2og-fe oxygenase family protein n=1 Tax=Colletotrichum truncatum TaxID=5467 RepID=A0ACC3YD83_COLTU|nr:2og-fe oxygenase family protein [Colletotrichum truncatum]KAF6784827.1 2og-fe oxygenase family protein [Colletotrichum truncatum]
MSLLEVIDYSALLAREATEVQKLVRVSSNQGLFFLDLGESRKEAVVADQQAIIEAQRKFFAQEPEQKLLFSSDLDEDGYDCHDEVHVQTLKLSRGQQLDGTLNLPVPIRPVEAEISKLATMTDDILRQLSTLLCESLDPPISTEVVSDSRKPGRSNMCLGLASAAAGTSLMEHHVDSDLLTLTFYDEPFLEVQQPKTGEWKVVDVCENRPIVNVGTTFQRVSEHRLRAPLHGVRQSEREINLIMYDLYACA